MQVHQHTISRCAPLVHPSSHHRSRGLPHAVRELLSLALLRPSKPLTALTTRSTSPAPNGLGTKAWIPVIPERDPGEGCAPRESPSRVSAAFRVLKTWRPHLRLRRRRAIAPAPRRAPPRGSRPCILPLRASIPERPGRRDGAPRSQRGTTRGLRAHRSPLPGAPSVGLSAPPDTPNPKIPRRRGVWVKGGSNLG